MASQDPVDLEDIAALIDGRLQGEERQRVMAQLADDEASYEVFQEVLSLQEDLQSEADETDKKRGSAKIFSIEPWRPKVAWHRWAAAAALVTLSVPLTLLIGRPFFDVFEFLFERVASNSTESLTVASLETALSSPSSLNSRLDADWYGRGKRVTRGDGPRISDTDRLDFQYGVQIVDLHLAFELDQQDRARDVLGQILKLLSKDDRLLLAEQQLSQQLFDELETKSAPELEKDRVRLEEELRVTTAALFFDLGRWVEAGRLAATVGHTEYFVDRRARRMLKRLEEAQLHDQVPILLKQIVAEAREPEPDQQQIEDDLIKVARLSGALM